MFRSWDVGLGNCGCRLAAELSIDSGCGCIVMKPSVVCPCSDLGMFGWGVLVAGCPPTSEWWILAGVAP